MSKKLEAIKKAVFYAQQKPEMLANILAGVVSDIATSVEIAGADSITIPSGDTANTEDYTATILSQFGDTMTAEVTYTLKAAVTGVSISDNTVSVASTASAGSFIVVATSGTVSAEKEVSLVAE